MKSNISPKSTNSDIEDELMYFVIGAQKSGTTWLHNYLSSHPETSNGPLKEYHYFSRFHRRNRTGLGNLSFKAVRKVIALTSVIRRSNLSSSPIGPLAMALFGQQSYLDIVRGEGHGRRVFGDISPLYSMLDRTAFQEMNACHSNAKFIFIMRDPVKRLWSQLKMRAGKKLMVADVETAEFSKLVWFLSKKPDYFGRSNYKRTIEELESAVPVDRVLYLFYETLFEDQTIRQVCGFLGLEYKPADFDKKVNIGQKGTMPEDWAKKMRDHLDANYSFLNEKFGNQIPDQWN